VAVCSSLSESSGKSEREGRTLVNLAFEIDRPSKHLRKPSANRQAEAGTAVASCRRTVELTEIFEHLQLVVAADTHTRIANRDADRALPGLIGRANRHRSGRRELQRIAQKIQHDLLDLLTVALQPGQVLRHVGTYRQARALDNRLEFRHDLLDQ